METMLMVFCVLVYLAFGFALTAMLNEAAAFHGNPYWVQILLRLLFIALWMPIIALVILVWMISVPFKIIIGK